MNQFKKGLEDDPLKFLLYTAGVSLFAYSKVYKLFLFGMVAILEMIVFAGIIHYFYEGRVVELWKYSSFLCDVQGISGIYVAQILAYDKLADSCSFIQKNAWSLKSAGEEIFIQISSECRLTIILCHAATFLVIMACVLLAPFVGDEMEWQYEIYYLKNSPPILRVLFDFTFPVILFISGTSLTPLINLSIYNLGHLKFQYQLLNASIIRFGSRRVYHINDVRYQERIARQLKLCIKRQLQVDNFYTYQDKVAGSIVISLCLFGLNIFVSSSFFIVSGVSPVSNFRMYTCIGAWFTVLSVFCLFGQKITEETENTFWNLCECHWEDWNNQNRRTLLMMLLKTTGRITLTGNGFVNVNYTLMSKMWRLGNLMVSIFAYNLR